MKEKRIERDLQRNGDHYVNQYTEEGFFKKMPKLARTGSIKATAYAFVLYYTLAAPTTPAAVKVSIVLSLGYFIAPFDVIPDFLGGIGFADDLVVLNLGLSSLCSSDWKDYVTPAILKKAIKSTKKLFPKEPIEIIKDIINQSGFYYEQI